MRWKSKIGAWLAALLLALLSASPALAYTAAYFYPQQYQLGEGVTYYDAIAENELGAQRLHYIEYQPNESVVPIVAYGRGFYGRSSIGYVADYLKNDLGYDVLAGFNADFFNTNSGVPIGIVVQDGKLITSAGGAYAVGFRADGSYIFGKPVLNMYVNGPRGGVTVENLNKTRSSYTVNLYDHNWGDSTRLDKPGTNVVLEKIDDIEPYIGCSIRCRVVSVREETGATPIAANQMVLTIAATGDATKLGIFAAGDEVTLTIGASDPAWKEAVYAVGGKSLVLNGQVAAGDSPTGNAARTAIGFRADGSMFFLENDGRQADYSVGLSPAVLAQEMINMGAVNALNLDGGGSSVMSVKRLGRALDVVNSPSDGQPRLCANYIFLINQQDAGRDADVLQIEAGRRYLLAGSALAVKAVGLNAALDTASLPDYVDWSVTEGDAEIEADGDSTALLTAGDEAGKVTFRAICGDLAAEQNVYILKSVSQLQIMRDGAAVSTLNVLPGDEVTLSAAGVYKGEAVALDNRGLTWSVSGDIGMIDEDGVYHAGGKDTSGQIIVQAGNTTARLVVLQQAAGDGIAIVGVNLPTKVASGASASFSFRVAVGYGGELPDKDALTLTLDGQPVDFDYAWATGIVNCEIAGLADGQHRLTLAAKDAEGNLTRKSLTFTVGDKSVELKYTDVPAGHWAAENIAYLSARGLMQGETDAAGNLTFNPSRNLTRAEFAVIAARYLKLDTSQEVSLPYADRADIPSWALGAIRAVYAEGIMTGEDVKGTIYFYPRNNISRQEAMAVISRILGEGYAAGEQTFADGDQISGWAKEHVSRLVTLGFVGGYEDGTIKPLANITRAEIAKILFNLY